MEFKDLSKEDRLLSVCKTIVENMPKLAVSLKEGKTNERFLSMDVWWFNQMFGLKSFFIDNDINTAKLHFYNCGKADELSISKYDAKILDSGINHLSYALLSDNGELIHDYADLQHSTYQKMVMAGNSTSLYILQCLVKDDWTGYERVIPVMKNKAAGKFKMELDLEFYEALAERNKSKIERVLAELVSPAMHKRRNKNYELINEFVSHPALGYAKLAWMKGIEVKVDSPLVPAALLPVKPVENYKNIYPFLDDVK